MAKQKVLVMIDTETTDLDPTKALAWEVGLVIAGLDYSIINALEWRVPIDRFVWNAETFKFCADQHGLEFMESVSPPNPSMETLIYMAKEYNRCIHDLATALLNISETHEVVGVIMNHVEFDKPIMCNTLKRAGLAGVLPFKYNVYFDLQSLCRGAAGSNFADVYASFKALQSRPVAHRGVADCISQFDMLKHFGVTW